MGKARRRLEDVNTETGSITADLIRPSKFVESLGEAVQNPGFLTFSNIASVHFA